MRDTDGTFGEPIRHCTLVVGELDPFKFGHTGQFSGRLPAATNLEHRGDRFNHRRHHRDRDDHRRTAGRLPSVANEQSPVGLDRTRHRATAGRQDVTVTGHAEPGAKSPCGQVFVVSAIH